MLVEINDHEENVHGVGTCFFPFFLLVFPLNLVAGNTTSANLCVRGTQDRYNPSAEILQVSRIPIGGSQLSDKPVSRLPSSFADRLANVWSAATRRDLHFHVRNTKSKHEYRRAATAYYCFMRLETLLLFTLPTFISTTKLNGSNYQIEWNMSEFNGRIVKRLRIFLYRYRDALFRKITFCSIHAIWWLTALCTICKLTT